MDMLQENAGHGTFVDIATRSITTREGGCRTSNPTVPRVPVLTTTLDPDAPPFESTTTTLCASERQTVLLQMAWARVYNPLVPQPVTELCV